MKELLDKFLLLFKEWVEKLSSWEEGEAIKKFTEASEMSSELSKKADLNIETEIKKFFESDLWKESIKKYADLYVSDSTFTELLDQIKWVSDKNSELEKKVSDLEKEKQNDDKIIEKALNEQWDEIDDIKKTLEKRVSKIA